jgi:hypothetical protein
VGSRTLIKQSDAKIGRPKGKRLSQKDLDVLHRIARKGFQSYPSLRSSLIKDMNRQHSWWFMKRLVKLGLLVESKGDLGGILGWSLSKAARKNLFLTEEEELRTDCNSPRYRGSFIHDEIVSEIEDMLRMSPLIKKWTPEHVVRKDVMTKLGYAGHDERASKLSKVPDALFEMDIGGSLRAVALELELARKARKRVYDRIEAHVINPEIDSVLFIVSDENHLQFLWDVYQDVLSHSFRVKLQPNQNGIYFSTLENLRTHRLRANFRGLDEIFSFESLRMRHPGVSSDIVG